MGRKTSAAARLICLLLVLCALAGCGGGGGELHLPERPENGCVLDVAGVLDSGTVERVLKENETLRAATGASITLVTVDVLGGKEVSEYANRLYEDWGVGDTEQRNGLLVLLAVEDKTYWLIQGAGLRDDLTDDALREYAWNYLERDFSEGNYDAGARKLCDALFAWYKDYYAKELGATDAPDEPAASDAPAPAPAQSSGGTPWWLVAVIAVAGLGIVAAVVIKLRSGSSRRRRYQGRRRRR